MATDVAVRAVRGGARRRTRAVRLSTGDRIAVAAMLCVPTLVVGALIWFPTVASIVLSFTNWDGIGGVGTAKWVGTQNYRGLKLSFQRRAANGLSLSGNYTVSHCTTDTPVTGNFVQFNSTWLKPGDPSYDRGNCPYNQREIANFTGVSDSLLEGRNLPVPSGVSTERPGGERFFGRGGTYVPVTSVRTRKLCRVVPPRSVSC